MAQAAHRVNAVILPPLPRPDDDEVPEWSEETLKALDNLNATERSFVEHLATGCNNAEAYRRATGKYTDGGETDFSRSCAYRFLSRPRVKTALSLALKDTNFDARMDRTWMLQRLEVALERAEEFSTGLSAAKIIAIIAKMQGLFLPRVPQQTNQPQEPSPAVKRFFDAIEEAKAKVAERKAAEIEKARSNSAMPDAGCPATADPAAATKIPATVEPPTSAPSQPGDSSTTIQRREQDRAAESRRQKVIDQQREAERIAEARRREIADRQEAEEREQTRNWVARQSKTTTFMGAILG